MGVIVRPPAAVLHGRPSISSDRIKEYVQRSLDLTMEGGTTSGVVCPLAICELATDFRFRNVGGASAGAIAAGLAAAAELGRNDRVLTSGGLDNQVSKPEDSSQGTNATASEASNHIRRGFTGLTDIMSWLIQTGPDDQEADEYRLACPLRIWLDPTPFTLGLIAGAVGSPDTWNGASPERLVRCRRSSGWARSACWRSSSLSSARPSFSKESDPGSGSRQRKTVQRQAGCSSCASTPACTPPLAP
jgi:hypothetical protein